VLLSPVNGISFIFGLALKYILCPLNNKYEFSVTTYGLLNRTKSSPNVITPIEYCGAPPPVIISDSNDYSIGFPIGSIE